MGSRQVHMNTLTNQIQIHNSSQEESLLGYRLMVEFYFTFANSKSC